MKIKTIKTMRYSIIGVVLLLTAIFINVQVTFSIEKSSMWSLLNLILVVGNLMLSGVLLINYLRSRKNRSENSSDEYGLLKLFSLFIAIFAGGIFSVTQNMTLPMTLVDEWTFLMVVIAVIQIAIGIFTVMTLKLEKNDVEENSYTDEKEYASI